MDNVIQVSEQNASIGSKVIARGNKYGAQVATELHGKYAEVGLRGRIFSASTIIAGVVIPVAATTLNSKFTLYNPIGSGKIVELISFHLGSNAATTVVNGIGLMIQRSTTNSGGVPTLSTACNNLALGVGGSAKATGWAQATLTNVAIAGVLAGSPPFAFYNMFTFGATTDANGCEMTHNFDGRILLNPDDLVAAVTTVAASQACFCQIVWAEHDA